jgi:dienelactone hydrolase
MRSTAESFPSAGTPIAADVFIPTAAGRHPAVLILHGTYGLRPEVRDDLESFAEALVEKRIAAVIPHHFEKTGTVAGDDTLTAIGSELPSWQTTCCDVLQFMRGHSGVDAARLGVIGFSLGGHLR